MPSRVEFLQGTVWNMPLSDKHYTWIQVPCQQYVNASVGFALEYVF